MKYAVWNNKGGVGKSFLTFVLSTEYAIKYPDKKVCVIDMCPQANVSEIILGGNGIGYENLSEYIGADVGRRTVGGYFDKRLSNPDSALNSESDYIIEVYREKKIDTIPENLILVCGDPSLELQVQSINQIASVDLPESRWMNVHNWIVDLQKGISSRYANEVVYFIDCNPSFATYTAQALLASNRLIVPCTADGASARAIDNIGQLLYGVNVPNMYAKTNFASKAKENNLSLPNIHLVLFNRHTTSRDKPSKAFNAMYTEIRNRANILNKEKGIFTGNNTFQNVPDAHAVAITSSEKALPVSNLQNRQYQLEHGSTQVNKEPLERYQKAIEHIIPLL